jgi:hypothetical protein
MMGCDDRFNRDDGPAVPAPVGGKRRQMMVGDVVNVEGFSFTIKSILSGGRFMMKANRQRVVQFTDEGVRTRNSLADDLAENARAAVIDCRNVSITPQVVLDIVVPAIRAAR